MLATGGTVAIVGSRGSVEVNPRDLMSREASVVGVMGESSTLPTASSPSSFVLLTATSAAGTDGSEAFAAIEAGTQDPAERVHPLEKNKKSLRYANLSGLLTRTVRPIVAKSFPLSQAAAAHTEVIEHTSGTAGKIVLLPWV
jgi:NADPH:quinone reductase-like Zn-dependent oxidoreductase